MKHFKIRPIFFLIFLMQVHISYVNAQLPAYLPTDGLIGWWPFNGNANDESGNGHNGTVNGATLSNDRNGIANSSYFFNGLTDFISIPDGNNMLPSKISIASWIKIPSNYTGNNGVGRIVRSRFYGYTITFILSNNSIIFEIWTNTSNSTLLSTQNVIVNDDSWHHIVGTFNGSEIKLYFDNQLIGSLTTSNSNIFYSSDGLVMFGRDGNNPSPLTALYQGWIDDIGIWNRALTQQEITNLYNSVNCPNNTAITPQTNLQAIGSTATFTASTSAPNPSYVWQSDFGQGFQTLRDYGSYSGSNTSTLKVSNVQLANHNQPFRVIASESGICFDTSEIVRIQLADTCVQAITDTTFTTVTDTLIIHTMVTDINAIPFVNTIKLFPNPTSTHLIIDYGNFSSLVGYQLRVTNLAGQVVFHTAIHQQSEQLSLSSWGGAGLYLVFLVDPQGHTVDTRKIVLK